MVSYNRSLNSIHAMPSSDFGTLADGAQEYLPACRSHIEALAGLVPKDHYYKVGPGEERARGSA